MGNRKTETHVVWLLVWRDPPQRTFGARSLRKRALPVLAGRKAMAGGTILPNCGGPCKIKQLLHMEGSAVSSWGRAEAGGTAFAVTSVVWSG